MAAVKFSYRSVTERVGTPQEAARPAGAGGRWACVAAWSLAVVTWTLAAAAWPSADADALARRLDSLDGFAAHFHQVIAGARGQILEQSSGHVLLKRPNFKWVVDDPYPQIIVADGQLLKVYDPDLEQLTVRPLSEALADTPVALLTRSDVALDESFHIIALPPAGTDAAAAAGAYARGEARMDGDIAESEVGGGEREVDTFVVSPKGEDSLFAEIRMTFSEQGLDSLGIADHLGQYTEIRFQADPDRVIQSSDFELKVPPETDVIGG